MFFRFVASLILVVMVSMVGIGLEKQTLEMKRAVSRQYFQVDLLLEMHARLRLKVQEHTAPTHLVQIDAETSIRTGHRSTTPAPMSVAVPSNHQTTPTLPLLRWEHPAPLKQK